MFFLLFVVVVVVVVVYVVVFYVVVVYVVVVYVVVLWLRNGEVGLLRLWEEEKRLMRR